MRKYAKYLSILAFSHSRILAFSHSLIPAFSHSRIPAFPHFCISTSPTKATLSFRQDIRKFQLKRQCNGAILTGNPAWLFGPGGRKARRTFSQDFQLGLLEGRVVFYAGIAVDGDKSGHSE